MAGDANPCIIHLERPDPPRTGRRHRATCGYSRGIMATASRSTPLTSMPTRLIVPPLKRWGLLAGVVAGHRLAAFAADAETLASDGELAERGSDATLAESRSPSAWHAQSMTSPP